MKREKSLARVLSCRALSLFAWPCKPEARVRQGVERKECVWRGCEQYASKCEVGVGAAVGLVMGARQGRLEKERLTMAPRFACG